MLFIFGLLQKTDEFAPYESSGPNYVFSCSLAEGLNLHKKCQEGNLKTVQLYVNNGGNIDIEDDDHNTMFHYAVQGKYIEMTRFLLQNNANVGKVGRTQENGQVKYVLPSYEAIKNELWKEDEIGELLITKISQKDEEAIARLLLILACKEGRGQIVENYIKNGGDVVSLSTDHMSLLHFAVRWNKLDIVNCILAQGPDLEATDQEGCRAFCYTWTNDDVSVISIMQVLLRSGADILYINNHQNHHTWVITEEMQKLWLEFTEYLQLLSKPVPSLFHLSRVCARKQIIQPYFRTKVWTLPLPDTIKEYLVFSDCPLMNYS